jgi:hypothetical protein
MTDEEKRRVNEAFKTYRKKSRKQFRDKHMMMALDSYKEAGGDITELIAPPEPSPAPMISLGNRNYEVSGQTQVVEVNEDCVLAVFFRAAKGKVVWIGMDKQKLINQSSYETAPRILRRMKSKYKILAPAIDCPGIRGRGGLKILVGKLRKPRKT